MKKILLLLFAIVLLGGAGAGFYFYFQQPAQAAFSEGDANHDKAENKTGGHGSSDNHAFYELDPLLLPIVDESGVTQVVSLVIVIEVADSKAAAKVEHLAPRLKDAFIQDMYGMLNRHAALRGGVVQVGMIKERLQKISYEVLEEDLVEDVLLQVVQQRPF